MTSPSPSSEPPSDSRSGSPTPPLDDGVSVSPRVRNGIAITITAVWAVGLIADAAMSTFSQHTLVHTALIGLAASVFGSNFVKGLRP